MTGQRANESTSSEPTSIYVKLKEKMKKVLFVFFVSIGIFLFHTSPAHAQAVCELEFFPLDIDTRTQITVTGKGVPRGNIQLRIDGPSSKNFFVSPDSNKYFSQPIGELDRAGRYLIRVRQSFRNTLVELPICATLVLQVGPAGSPFKNSVRHKDSAIFCDPKKNQLETAVGCIPLNDVNQFTKWFLGWAIGIAGGIAFLLIVFSGFQIMTASGNPERLQNGRELLTAAISGLILIIFSVFLLKLIGIDILKIPGFGFS